MLNNNNQNSITQSKLFDLVRSDCCNEFALLFEKNANLTFETINNLIPSKSGSLLHLCALYNAHQICHFIFSKFVPHFDIINSRDYEGKSPLHVCSIFGSKECAKILLKNGANVNTLKRGDWTPLMNAVAKCDLELVSMQLNYGAELSLCNKDGWNSIHLAARTGDISLLSLLEEHSISNTLKRAWRVKTKNGRTLLHIVAMHSHVAMVKHLLDDSSLTEYFETNLCDVCGVTAFMDAARMNCREICKLLWNRFLRQLTVNDVDNSGRSALHMASQNNSLDTIDFLILNLKADVNLQDNWGQTPIFLSVREGHMEATKLLIELGAKPLQLDAKNRSPLDIAEQYGHVSIYRYLFENCTPLNKNARQ